MSRPDQGPTLGSRTEHNASTAIAGGVPGENLENVGVIRGDGAPAWATTEVDPVGAESWRSFVDDPEVSETEGDPEVSETEGDPEVSETEGDPEGQEVTLRFAKGYELLGKMLPPKGSIKRGLKNIMQTGGVAAGAFLLNKYGGDVFNEVLDGAKWVISNGIELAGSVINGIGSIAGATVEAGKDVASFVANTASDMSLPYFLGGVANGVMRGAIDNDPSNDGKKNMVSGAILGTAAAYGNPDATSVASFATGHLAGSTARRLVGKAGSVVSAAAINRSSRRAARLEEVGSQQDGAEIANNITVVSSAETESPVTPEAQEETEEPAEPTVSKKASRKEVRNTYKEARRQAINLGRSSKVAAQKLSEEI